MRTPIKWKAYFKKLRPKKLFDWKKIERVIFSKIFAIHIFIFLTSLNIFLLGIDRSPFRIFDENHYINAALDFLNHGVKGTWSFPPLGEMLIASGISLFGDNPLGWRIMGVIFGSLSLNAMFYLGIIFFKKVNLALEVTLFCLLNQLLFVQARVATLDIFMFGFLAWGFVFYFRYLQKSERRDLILAGICFGLGIACKWFVIIPAIFCLIHYLFNEPKLWKKRWKEVSINLVAVPALIYFVTFSFSFGMTYPVGAPHMGSSTLSAWDFIALHFEMLKTHLRFENPAHPFESAWYTWPLAMKGVWYERGFVTINDQEYLTGVVLVGNPLILWGGFASIILAIFHWIKRKNELAKTISLIFLTLFLSWAVIPRKTTFFYYYFPASMMLSLGLVFAFETLRISKPLRIGFIVLCALMFFFFYPALASVSVPEGSALFYVLTR